MTNQPTKPKQPNKRGRQTALTPELQKKLIEVLQAGNYVEAACNYVGIDVTTYYDWIKRGEGRHATRPQNELYVEFVKAVNKALALPEVKATAVWVKAQDEDWHAAAEFLARRYPDRWGRQRTDVNIINDPYSKAIAELRKERTPQE